MRLRSASLAIVLLASAVTPAVAEERMQLRRLSGLVVYGTPEGTRRRLVGSLELPADDLAITRVASQAELTLPDSSLVTIGERSQVRIGEFLSGVEGPGSTITIERGALHFLIEHPKGAQANYTFVTPTSQIAVRGTEGVVSDGPEGLQVVCLAGTDRAVAVALADGTSYAVPVGHTLHARKGPGGKLVARVRKTVDHSRLHEFDAAIAHAHQARVARGFAPGEREAATGAAALGGAAAAAAAARAAHPRPPRPAHPAHPAKR